MVIYFREIRVLNALCIAKLTKMIIFLGWSATFRKLFHVQRSLRLACEN